MCVCVSLCVRVHVCVRGREREREITESRIMSFESGRDMIAIYSIDVK